jgi:hypothetical protein
MNAKKICAKRGHHNLGKPKKIGMKCIGATPMKIAICNDCGTEVPVKWNAGKQNRRGR